MPKITNPNAATVVATLPQSPWTQYPSADSVPLREFKALEIHAIALVREPWPSELMVRRKIVSRQDGPMALCSIYGTRDSGEQVCIANFPSPQEAVEYAAELDRRTSDPLTRVRDGIFALHAYQVEGHGYLADPSAGDGLRFTLDPLKAALFNGSENEVLTRMPGEARGEWVQWWRTEPMVIDREAERQALIDRTFRAARDAMGHSAPESDSIEESEMKDAIASMVDRCRADRLTVFSGEEVAYLCELAIEARCEIVGDETDEDLCRLIADMSFNRLFGLRELDDSLLDTFASPEGVRAMSQATSQPDAVDRQTVLGEILARLDEREAPNPYAGICQLDDAEVESPRG